MAYYTELSAKLLGPLVTGSRTHQIDIHRTIVLLLTFLIYATYRLSRRPLSIVKSVLSVESCSIRSNSTGSSSHSCGWAPFNGDNGKEILGGLDSSFLFVYAFGMYAAGYIAERVNVRYFLTISLAMTGLLSIAMGFARILEIHSLWYWITIQVLMGLSQTGLPAVVSVVGYWYFGSTKKGLIFGCWNWHTSVGNMVGAAVAGAFVEINWSYSFIVPGCICISVALIVFLFLIPKPSDVGLEVELATVTAPQKTPSKPEIFDLEKSPSKSALQPQATPQPNEAISVLKALQIPGVIEFALCLFFTKLVSYTFLYWLPMYLKISGHFTSTSSAYASIMFDVGGCLGSIAIGFMADRTGASGLTCIFFLLCSIPALYTYYLFSHVSLYMNQLLQFIAGAFINGPFSLIMATVSANLACKVPSKCAMATVCALINGTGTVGAAIGPSLAGIVAQYSWKNVFWMCIAADVCATLCLARIGLAEVKAVWGRKEGKRGLR